MTIEEYMTGEPSDPRIHFNSR